MPAAVWVQLETLRRVGPPLGPVLPNQKPLATLRCPRFHRPRGNETGGTCSGVWGCRWWGWGPCTETHGLGEGPKSVPEVVGVGRGSGWLGEDSSGWEWTGPIRPVPRRTTPAVPPGSRLPPVFNPGVGGVVSRRVSVTPYPVSTRVGTSTPCVFISSLPSVEGSRTSYLSAPMCVVPEGLFPKFPVSLLPTTLQLFSFTVSKSVSTPLFPLRVHLDSVSPPLPLAR